MNWKYFSKIIFTVNTLLRVVQTRLISLISGSVIEKNFFDSNEINEIRLRFSLELADFMAKKVLVVNPNHCNVEGAE